MPDHDEPTEITEPTLLQHTITLVGAAVAGFVLGCSSTL